MLAVLGSLALVALGVLLWQRQQPPLVVGSLPDAMVVAQWDRALERSRQVDINTASVAELERLPQVGPTLARRIVAYRTQHGRFATARALTQVPGVGSKTYEAIRPYVE